MTAYEIVTLTLAGGAGICMPVLIYMLTRQDKHREENFVAIHARLSHLDECVDDLKVRVLGGVPTKADLEGVRAESMAHAERVRAEMGQRVYRLEDRALAEHGA